jgi:hypothetical protein
MSELIDPKEELQKTVEALEQILEVMPDDLFTLRALYETCLKLQLPEKAVDSLHRLDDAARAAQDAGTIAFVIEQYQSIEDEVPEVRRRIDRLRELQMVSDLIGENVSVRETPAMPVKKGLEAEMALAWDLFQDEQLSQEEYSSVLHDLTEMSSGEMTVPVTVLHILHDRNFSRFERLMTYLCRKSDVPVMSLGQYDENEELCRLLPLDFMTHHGALPFARVGTDLQLAVLNPFDRELVDEVSRLVGCRCHPFLVTPQEYDQRLAAIRKALAA